MSFVRYDAGAQLIDVTIIFKEEVDLLADSGTVGVADVFCEALIGCGKDFCCMCSRDSKPIDSHC